MFLSAFACFVPKVEKNQFTTVTWMCLIPCVSVCVCVCMSVPMCEHALPVFRGQKWRCYPLVIHHKRDTLSPALRYAEAMFYKRITRQRAPAGHPLPPCATCKDVQWTHRSHAPAVRAMFEVCIYKSSHCPALGDFGENLDLDFS